jgi:hypothetical protein
MDVVAMDVVIVDLIVADLIIVDVISAFARPSGGFWDQNPSLLAKSWQKGSVDRTTSGV